jgi:diguanylate cyclase (GGDEF)-like protein
MPLREPSGSSIDFRPAETQRRSTAITERLLLVDDDSDALALARVNLTGYDIETAEDGEAALEAALARRPDLILLDVMMPRVDGIEVCRRLRSNPRTATVPVIMVTARSQALDKLVGLTAGADDYIIKPYDPVELVARVRTALRRVRQMRDLNPLTGFPGNLAIYEEIERRLAEDTPFALMHVDLDNFKAFNDHYGFVRGDRAIKLLASTLTQVLATRTGEQAFIGHIGGDDFVVLCEAGAPEEIAGGILSQFDGSIRTLYDTDDLERGYVEVADRRGSPAQYPVMTVSIGIALHGPRKLASVAEAGEIAGEMKHVAKQSPESSFAIDRRRG